MAKVKYKYGNVREIRHTVRTSAATADTMLRMHPWQSPEAVELSKEASSALHGIGHILRGQTGVSKDTQIERLTAARERVKEARKHAAKLADATETDQENNLAVDIDNLLLLANDHLTAGIAHTKNKRELPKTVAATSDEVLNAVGAEEESGYTAEEDESY